MSLGVDHPLKRPTIRKPMENPVVLGIRRNIELTKQRRRFLMATKIKPLDRLLKNLEIELEKHKTPDALYEDAPGV